MGSSFYSLCDPDRDDLNCLSDSDIINLRPNKGYKFNLIYYDESISKNEETHGFFKFLKNNIKGVFFACPDFDSFQKIFLIINQFKEETKFVLLTSGSSAEKIFNCCNSSNYIQEGYIFCMRVNKYKPLMSKYNKIKQVTDNFFEIMTIFESLTTELNTYLKATELILFDDYCEYYVHYHKKLVSKFNDNNNSKEWKTSLNKYIKEFKTSNMTQLEEPTVEKYIKVYSGESEDCYTLNQILRELNLEKYDLAKDLAGHFSYELYNYAKNNKEAGLYEDKKLFRRVTLSLSDIFMYYACVGGIICFPAFTSTSSLELNKYDFPTPLSKKKIILQKMTLIVCLILSISI